MVKRSTKSGVNKAKKPAKAKTVKAPPPPEKPPTSKDEINRIGDIIKNARGIWFGLLGASVFAAITLFSVKDASFFIPSEETKLPLLGISVPITSFFWAGALLVTALYTYLHLYLVQLWDALGDADPLFEGKPLADVIHPWLVSDAALRMRDRTRKNKQDISDIDLDAYHQHIILGNPLFKRIIKWMNRLDQWWNGSAKANDLDRSSRRRGMSFVGTLVSVSLVWFCGLVVIAFFWWRSMPAHDVTLTSWLAYLLIWTLYVFWQSSSYALAKLGKKPPKTHRHRFIVFSICIMIIVQLTIVRTEQDIWEGYPRIDRANLGEKCTENQKNIQNRKICGFILNKIQEFLRPARAEMAETIFTQKPSSWKGYDLAKQEFRLRWCKQIGQKSCTFNPLDGDALFDEKEEKRFDKAWEKQLEATLAAFSKPDLRKKRLEGADLRFAQLEGVRLDNARLQGANLAEAKMQDVVLKKAKMQGTSLGRAELQWANLSGAEMQDADLTKTKLQGASLRAAQMQGALLQEVEMQGADLTRAQMQKTILWGAQMQGTTLRHAQMQGAYLGEVKMQSAILSDAQLQRAVLPDAEMQGADLTKANMQGAEFTRARMQGTPEKTMALGSTNLIEADFRGTSLRFVDFTDTTTTGMRNFDKSFGDGSVKLAEGMKQPEGWCEHALPDAQYWGRYKGWLKEHGIQTALYLKSDEHPIIPFGTPCPE